MCAVPARRLGPATASTTHPVKSVSVDTALRCIQSGNTILVGGFMNSGTPQCMLKALLSQNIEGLTLITNDAGTEDSPLGRLILSGSVSKLQLCYADNNLSVKEMARAGSLEVEFIPLGTLLERIRASGSGLGGILTPTGVGTSIAQGKPTYEIQGNTYLVEEPIQADVALLNAYRGDSYGNLVYQGTERNFNVVMATAADLVIAEVEQIYETGDLNPNQIETPGIFVDYIFEKSI